MRPQSSYINPIQRQAAPHTVHTSRRMSTSAPHRSFAPPRHASPHTRLSGVRPSPHANVIILSGSLLQIKLNSFRHSPYISIITNVITNASSSASSRDSSRPHCGAHHTRVREQQQAPLVLFEDGLRRRQRCSAGAPQLWSLLWSSSAICFAPS